MESEFLLGNIKYMSDDNLAMIYLNTSTSLILLERMDESNRYAQMAHEKLLRSSNRQMKIGALLRIAELQKVMGENAQAETNILEAIASAKRSGDGALEARSQMALAHSLDSDIETDRIMAAYERALWLFGDDEHERVLQEKAGIYHEIAVLYQKQGKYEDAEAAFRTAIHLVQRITPDFPNMPYVIQAEYAKFLHLTDRHDAAIDLLIHLARELMQRGMNPGVVEQALAEIDTPEGSRVPSAAAKQWAEALVYVSQGRIDEAEFVEKMYAMLQHFNENGWRNEEMYVLSLLDLWADLKRQVITEANPYYKFYQWAKEHYK
jgi:tetratricopeptide (TPR) repeat protein